MRYSEFVVWLIPVLLLIVDELSRHYPRLESSAKAVSMGIVVGMTYSIYMEKLPEIKEITKIVESIKEDDPAYSLLIKISSAEKVLLELSDNQIKLLFEDQFHKNIEHMESFVDDLRNKEIRISEGDAYLFAIKNFETAEASIDATSYVNPEKWWINKDGSISNEGKNYIQKNMDAVKRGIKVRRTFIFETKKEREMMARVIDANKKAGVDVYVVYKENLPEDLNKFDFLMVDNKIAGELLMDDKSRSYHAFVVTYSIKHVNEINEKVQVIFRKAEKI